MNESDTWSCSTALYPQHECIYWLKQLSLIELLHNSSLNENAETTQFRLLYNQAYFILERLLKPRLEERNKAIFAELLAEGFMNYTANHIKNAKLALQRAFEIQKGYYDQRHGPLPPYGAEDYATVRLK